MILSYITDTYSFKPVTVQTEPVSVIAPEKPEEIKVNTVISNTALPEDTIETDTYEMKYKLLMHKIEKERFERELLADTR